MTDVTVEALAAVLADAPRGVLLARDELAGFIGAFDAYKKSKDADRAHYLEMHRAGQIIIDRKSGDRRRIFIPRAAVSICGTIQPQILRRALTEDFFSSGFTARCLLVNPPTPPKRWRDEVQVSIDLGPLFERLLGLEMVEGKDGFPAPKDLEFSRGALDTWRSWYDAHNAEAETLDDNDRAAWSKIEGYVPRFALLFRLLRGTSGQGSSVDQIEMADLEAAIRVGEWFGNESRRVYSVLRQSPDASRRERLLAIIENHGGTATANDLRRYVRRFKDDLPAAKAALNDLVAAGYGHWSATEGPGRPTEEFTLHRVYGSIHPPLDLHNRSFVDRGKGNSPTTGPQLEENQ